MDDLPSLGGRRRVRGGSSDVMADFAGDAPSSKTADFSSTRGSSSGGGRGSRSGVPVLMFNSCKRETHGVKSGLRKAARKLKSQYKVVDNRDAITLENLARASCVVFASPRERFEAREFDAIKQYLAGGGSVLFLASEGTETEEDAAMRKNLNLLLFQYGIEVNNDAVVRTVFMPGYFHPKECYVANGVVNVEMANAAWRLAQSSKKGRRSGSKSKTAGAVAGGSLKSKGLKSAPAGLGGLGDGAALGAAPAEVTEENGGLTFVYPYGSTLNVKRPAVATMSSGPISYPLQRPVCAFWDGGHIAAPSPTAAAAAAAAEMAAAALDASSGDTSTLRGSAAVAKHRGRLVVLGSTKVFDDEFIGKEQNSALLRVCLQWLMVRSHAPLACGLCAPISPSLSLFLSPSLSLSLSRSTRTRAYRARPCRPSPISVATPTQRAGGECDGARGVGKRRRFVEKRGRA